MDEVLERLDSLRGGIRQARAMTPALADELLDILQQLVLALLEADEA